MENTSTSNRNKIFVLLIAFLVIVIGVLIWQYIELKNSVEREVAEKVQHIEEKQALNKELESLMNDYDGLKSDNVQLQSEIDNKKVQIEELLKEAEKYKGDRAQLLKLQKETKTLRQIMKGYVRTIDSLNTLNIALKAENQMVKQELGQEKSKVNELNKVKENLSGQVKIASILECSDITVEAIFLRSSGKEVDTRRANKAEKIKSCFTIRENKVTPRGKKTFFIQIIGPDGNVLLEADAGDNKFNFEGQTGYFSVKKVVDYEGVLVSYCAYYNVPNGKKLSEGIYRLDLFESEAKIATTSLNLK
jgi:hypothetical protein